MGNHRSLDAAPVNDSADKKLVANAEGPSALQLDAGIGGPPGHKPPVDHYREAYMIDTKSSESQFMAKEPGRMRAHYGLEKDATSQQLFERMSEDGYKIYKGSSPELKHEVNEQFGTPGKGDLSKDQFIKAHDAFLFRDAGLDKKTSSYEELEKTRNKQTYDQVHSPHKAGKDHIDFD